MDANILIWIQENVRNDFLTPIMKGITWLGNNGMVWIVLTIVLLCVKKTRTAAFLASLALVGSLIISNFILKNAIARPRPYEEIANLVSLIEHPKDYSFPSGHTSAAFAVGVIYFRKLNKCLGIPMLIFAFIMGFSRLYLGVHYLTDVLGGMIIGTLIAIGVMWGERLVKKLIKKSYN